MCWWGYRWWWWDSVKTIVDYFHILKYFIEVAMTIYLLVGNESSIIVKGRWRRSNKENLEEETWFFVVNRRLPILNLNVTYVK